MKKFIIKSVYSLSIIFLLASCGGSSSTGPESCVPKDAHFALVVDPVELGKKGLPMRDLMEMSDQKGKFDVDAWFKSGVDTVAKVYFFADVTDNFRGGYNASVGKIKDVKKFKDYLTNLYGELKKIDETEIEYVSMTGFENRFYGIKGDLCIGLMQSEFAKLSIEENFKKLFALTKEESAIGSEKLFQKQVEAGSNIAVWINMNDLMEAIDANELRKVMSVIDFSDSYATIDVNFENGKILIETNQINNPETTKMMTGLLADKGISDNLLNSIPGDDLFIYYGINLNTNGILDILKSKGMLSIADEFLKKGNVSSKEIADAFTGEFVLTFNGVEMEKNERRINEMREMFEDGDSGFSEEDIEALIEDYPAQPTPKFSFSIGYDGKSKVGKMIKQMSPMLALRGFDRNGKCWTGRDGVSVYIGDDCIQFFGSNAFVNAINNGNIKPLDNDSRLALADNNSYAKIELLNFLKSISKIKQAGEELGKVTAMFPLDVITTSSEIKDDITTGTITIDMTAAKVNSLQMIIDFIENMKKENLLPL